MKELIGKIRNVDTHSFGFRLWMVLELFAVMVCGILWVILATTIWTTFENDQIAQVRQAGNIISSTYGREGFMDSLRSVARSGYFVQVLREDGSLLYSLDNTGTPAPHPQDNLVSVDIFDKLDETDGYYFYRGEDTVYNSQWLVQVQVMGLQDGMREVLFTSANLVPVSRVMTMLYSRLLLVTAAVLVVATLIALLLASGLGKPITKITQRASHMMDGNYNEAFPDSAYTELQQLSRTLDTAAAEFRRTEELRRDLIANVSHDMRTPLTMIRAYAEMVQQLSGDNPVKREEHLGIIIQETDKLTKFVNETLDLSRLQSGTVELHMEVFPLKACVESTLDDFRHLWERGDYHLFLSLDPGVLVRGDRRQLERVAFNLISNAFNYTGTDKTVYIEVAQVDGQARFAVTDTGPGITEEQLKEIWDRYYRIKRPDESSASTGVGLSIVKAILELHGARYGVDSVPGKGSSFWFALTAQ